MSKLVTLLCVAALTIVGCDDPDVVPAPAPSPLPASLTLSTFPTSVLNSGSDVTVTARVTNERGSLADGALVAFSTTSGTLSATSALTSSAGTATVTLSASESARVTARAAASSADLDVPAMAPFTISLSTPSPVFVDGAVFGVDVTPNRQAISPPGPAALTINCGFGSTVDVTVDRSYRCVFPSAGDFTVQAAGRTANGWTTTESARVTAVSRSAPTTPTTPTSSLTLSTTEISRGQGYAEWRFTVTATAAMGRVEFDFGDYTDDSRGSKIDVVPDGNRLTASAQYTYRPAPAGTLSKTYEVVVTVWPSDGRPAMKVERDLQVTVR